MNDRYLVMTRLPTIQTRRQNKRHTKEKKAPIKRKSQRMSLHLSSK
ncbi:Uncharacterised protein [Streptococcus pneumoniae]|nr:hypothetical protein [Streptococcus pneumoniae]COA53363.1 Uncharacterised protein [Streptococcus pneumoniae]COF69687.1 Uncharacterised protein [Streptococcus pneumoniae]